MKGYLKSSDGIFQLAPKVTTVGREGCDLVVQNVHVDFQHAVIEYSENEDCYVLQDLNTSQGTYVNECRVQNAAVRLAPGDTIRFGYNGYPYELVLEQSIQMAYPPVHQRPAWTQPLTVISDPLPPQVIVQEGLPHLRQVVATTTSTWDSNNRGPRPPPTATTIRSRPLSAGAIRNTRTIQAHTTQPRVDGWVQNGRRTLQSPSVTTQQVDIMALQEKEQRILRLQDEIKRLQVYEQECFRKDDIMQTLRQEVADLQVKVRRFETSQTCNDAELTQKLMQLENEVQQKRQEVQVLKDQLNRARTEQRPASAGSRGEMNDRVMEINSLKTELERVKKDKNITAGLVTQMQRDMANKDTSISRLTAEITNFKKEMKEKELQIQQLHTKWHKSPESRQRADDLDSKDKEAAQLRVNIKQQEVKINDQASVIDSLKLELEKLSKNSTEAIKEQTRLQKEMDATKSKQQDLERAERLVRVDLEQSSKRMERFRNRVVQVTFSTPGIKAPDQEITDDELLDTLKQIIDQRTELQRELGELKETLASLDKGKKEIIDNSKKLKDQLNQAVTRVKEKGQLCCRLKQEVDFVQTISAHESVAWMRDTVLHLLQAALAWETEIEGSLEKCQVNVKISEDAPWTHILTLREKAVQVREECEQLRARLDEVTEVNAKDLEANLESLSLEMEEKAKMEQEKIKLEFEEKFNKQLDEVRALESEKRESAMEEYKTKNVELEASMEKLKQNIMELETAATDNKKETASALEEVEQHKKIEGELREQLEELEKARAEAAEQLRVAVEKASSGKNSEIESYKEQIRQHSVTICAMEERLNKVVKKNKDYHSEIATYKSTVTDLREKLAARPEIPPKPKVIIQKPAQDVVAMEAVIAQLRLEGSELQRQLQQSEDVIMGLRRDLAGASAKLTDMTGELSESQKEEIERHRLLVKQQDNELTECRQQLAKLSEVVDKQSIEIKELNNDLTKQRTSLNKYKNTLNDRDSRLKALESDLETERGANKKNITLLEEEGRITSELTAIGAQCRGERHESVIARQREALTELRSRVKTLEMSNPPLPTKDQALQQVVLLKKELSELRASQALTETLQNSTADSSVLAQQVNRARGLDPHARAENEVERSAHRETMEALELSEQSYLVLLRGVASSLEMDEIGGLRSMAHIPGDERARLSRDRETACELVSSRIKVLKERITRKDELLQGYEKDLAKLRQAEKLAEQKHHQLEALSTDVRSRTEESQYLRESLQRTKDKLDQERRLNTNIKSKKTFHLENERVQKNGSWPKHSCRTEDVMGRQNAQKKAQQERLRRKNYEINTLKTELSTRDQDLVDTRRRLLSMEASACLEPKANTIMEPPVLFSDP